MGETDGGRFRALLEARHTFPGPYFVCVIAVNDDEVCRAVRGAVDAVLEDAVPEAAWDMRSSSGGRYVSHRATVPCRSVDDVLALYERIRAVRGVLAVL